MPHVSTVCQSCIDWNGTAAKNGGLKLILQRTAIAAGMNSGELFKARDMFRVPIVIVCPTCGRKHKEYIQVFNSFAQVRVILDGVDPYLIFIDKNDVWRETVCSGTICDKEECECDIDACHCDGACELCNEIHSDRDEDSDEC